jgi:hypothetical protein
LEVRPASERRTVADRPVVSERIAEATLAMRAPGVLVIFDLRSGARAGGDRALSEAVRIVDEQLDPGACDADLVRAVLGWVARVNLVEEERRAVDFQTSYASEVPEFGCA